MQIIARGWRRNRGNKTIMVADLENDYVRAIPEASTFYPNQTYIQEMPNGEIRILCNQENLVLNGNYQIIASMTKNDLLKLFVASHKNDSFKEIVEKLAVAIDS
jgi:transposase